MEMWELLVMIKPARLGAISAGAEVKTEPVMALSRGRSRIKNGQCLEPSPHKALLHHSLGCSQFPVPMWPKGGRLLQSSQEAESNMIHLLSLLPVHSTGQGSDSQVDK